MVGLRALLLAERERCCQLVDLAEALRGAVVDNDLERLIAVVREQEATAEKLVVLEQQRLDAMVPYAASLQRSVDQVTLSDVFPLVSPEEAHELAQLQEQLGASLRALADCNRSNQVLLETAASTVEGIMRVLLQLGSDPGGYAPSGQAQPRGRRRKLVDRLA